MPEISGGVTFESLGAIRRLMQGQNPLYWTTINRIPGSLPSQEKLKENHCGDGSKTLVYVTIGGGSSLIGERFLQIVLESLRMLPLLTGVVATGIAMSPEEIKSLDPPDNAIVRGFVAGNELIKASDVTVFHGGSSTLMTCIACGTPAVVVPSIGEQEDNGAVLAQNGAGLVLDKTNLTSQMMAEAIQKILGDAGYRQQALRLRLWGRGTVGRPQRRRSRKRLLPGRRLSGDSFDFGCW